MNRFLTANQISLRAGAFRVVPHIWKEGGRWHVSKLGFPGGSYQDSLHLLAARHVSKLNAAIEAAKA